MPNEHHASLTRYLNTDLRDTLTEDQREEILFLASNGMIHERKKCDPGIELDPLPPFDSRFVVPRPKPEFPPNETIKYGDVSYLLIPGALAIIGMIFFLVLVL